MKISEDYITNLPLYSNQKKIKKSDEVIFSEPARLLNLSVRSQNCLSQLKIQSIEELISLTPYQLLRIRNCGKKSVNEIQKKAKNYLLNYVDEKIINIIKNNKIVTEEGFRKKEISEEYLNKLPLFSNDTLYRKIELHASYKPIESIDNINLTLRSINCLSQLKIKTISELLFLSPSQLFHIRNCGKTTINNFQETVKKYLLTSDKDLSNTWDSFDSMIRSLINVKDRDLTIFKNRLGIGFEKPQTLEDAGKEFVVTRERTRQILNIITKKINSESLICMLQPLWDVIDSSLEKYNGAVCYDDVASDICKTLNWNKKIEGHAIAEFVIYFNDKYFIDHQSKIICFKKDVCLKCNNFWKNLNILVNDKGKLSIDKATKHIQYFCRTSCAKKMLDKRINKGMILYYLYIENNKEIKFEEDLLYSLKEYNRKKDIEKKQRLREQGSIFVLIEDILKNASSSMTNKEIKSILEMKGKIFAYDIASLIQKCENIFKWDLGIYIHRDNIQMTQDLLKTIYLYIDDEFKMKIPFLSIHKAFNKFENECKDEQIPTDMALYSALLIFKQFEYTLPQFPAIFLTENFTNETIHFVLEKYLLEKAEPVNYELMREFFVKNVGMKKKSFTWHIQQNDNIVKLSNNMITHRNLLPKTFIKPIDNNKYNKKEIGDDVNSIRKGFVIDVIRLCEINRLHISDTQKKIIKLFQENNFSISTMRLKLFSRINKLNGQQLINSINEKFIKEFNSRLVITEESTMKINERFLDKFGWQ